MKYHRYRSAYPRAASLQKSTPNIEDSDNFLVDQLAQYSRDRPSKTAQYIRSHTKSHNFSSVQLSQKKIEQKTPIMKNFSSEQLESQRFQRLQKLGLEDFMKELITTKKTPTKDYSSQVVEALNQTYLKKDKISSPQQILSGRLMKRSNQIFKSRNVEWNPEKEGGLPKQFQEMDSYIPSYMFPCRKKQANKLKKSNFSLYKEKSQKNSGKLRQNGSQNQFEDVKKKLVQKSRSMFTRDQLRQKGLSRSRENLKSERRIMSHPKGESVIQGTRIKIKY